MIGVGIRCGFFYPFKINKMVVKYGLLDLTHCTATWLFQRKTQAYCQFTLLKIFKSQKMALQMQPKLWGPGGRHSRFAACRPVRATLEFAVREAAGTAELRATAFLRAQSFSQIPSDRSDFARRAHLRMKADAIWEELEKRDAARDGVLVTTLIATTQYQDSWHSELADRSCTLPASTRGKHEVVVGTLDLNQGNKLPAEELIGQGDGSRAYLSNVCVLEAARRQGIARALIDEAARRAKQMDVAHLYVHVVAENVPARRLYQDQCGFETEQEEAPGVARHLNRPRRLLLCRCLL